MTALLTIFQDFTNFSSFDFSGELFEIYLRDLLKLKIIVHFSDPSSNFNLHVPLFPVQQLNEIQHTCRLN